MARKPKIQNTADDIINRILNSPIPQEGHLMHPLQPQKRDKKVGQVTLGDVNSKQKQDTSDWNARDFVDYFANKFQETTGGNYRRVYRADGTAFQEMLRFFNSNGMEKSEWTKKFIDWAFLKRDLIQRRFGYFNPHTILRVINYFYQDEVMPLVEEEQVHRQTSDTSLIDEISEVFTKGHDIEPFTQFGIPIIATYMIHVKKNDKARLIEAVRQRLLILMKNDRAEAKKVLLKSIINSPYPTSYELLDWRDVYSDITKHFEGESWWRDGDYRGKPLPKYKEIVTENKD